ncbi:MFS transporter [Sphingomonas sp. ST-64]|uniref:MFS transporter n=1 Tax=Sphingomonas plantiphila TaxID=3163295 RepID=A0ABW8YS06_9SPHN
MISADARPARAALPPPLSLRTRLAYGIGSASTGIKTRSFTAFLLIFYNQAVGLPPAMVASVILIATIYDSLVDPIIGQLSDNFRSRWGRRHPFMYAAALPLALGFYFLWNPPAGLTHGQLFAYMLTCLLVVRTFDTFFELPSVALGPELAPEYNERTKLISWRKAFETCGGLLMVLAGYRYFMAESTGGVTERAGYTSYSIVAAAIIFVVILCSAAGTHDRIRYLRQPPKRKLTPRSMFGEIFATLSNPSFVFMAIAGMIYMAAIGARAALEVYFYLYFWDFDQNEIAILTVAQVPGSLLGVVIAPVLVGWWGKKRATLVTWFSAMFVTLLPLALRTIDILPGNDHWIVFPVLLVENVTTQILLIAGAVLVPSMIADIVEDSELKTGRRSEGLLFSADNLFRKFVSGIGVFVAGLVLSAVGFDMKTPRGSVSESQLDLLALLYIPIYGGLILIAMWFVSRYRISKEQHEDNLRRLSEIYAEATTMPGDAELSDGKPLPRETRPNPVHP